MTEHERTYRAHLRGLATWVKQRAGCDIEQLLIQCLLPAMMRDAATRLMRFEVAPRYISGDLDHVGDWLASAVAADLKWLRNVDANGVPKKFSKLITVGDVKVEADRGLQRLLRNSAVTQAIDGEVDVIAAFDNGYTLLSLKTPAALDRESKEMQHCVGLGGYDEGVAKGTTSILSLRDSKGKAHVTLELDVESQTFVQIKGKQNRFPAQRYFDILIPWITSQGFEVRELELANGYFRQKDGPIRHVGDLNEGENITGNLTLRFDSGSDPDLVLPSNLRISGLLRILSDYATTKRVVFGRDTVVGSLETVAAKIVGLENVTTSSLRVIEGEIAPVSDGTRIDCVTYLSEVSFGDLLGRAVFGQSVEIVGCDKVEVPHNVSVRGDFSVSGARSVVVESGATFTRGLQISPNGFDGCMLTVGKNVTVCGSFEVSNCVVTLTEGLQVGGTMAMQFSTIGTLPPSLEVGGLTLSKVMGVREIPASVKINGDVYLNDTDVTSLGGRTHWPGDLRIPKSKITHLPHGLSVAGSLEVSWVPLEEFPRAMTIGGSLTAVGCGAGRIPEDAKIGGSIDLSKINTVSIPDGFVVAGCLNLNESYLRSMPKDVRVGEIIHLGKFPVDRITRSFVARSYALAESFVIDLSDLVEVEGHLWIDAKDTSMLPDGMHIGGRLIVHGDHPDAKLPDDITVSEYVRGVDSDALERMIPKSAIVGGRRFF